MKGPIRESQGQVLVLLALVMVVLLGVIGLAVDLGRAYGVKARLNAAVDAASIEAANALAQGSGEAGMIRQAREVAADYFSANCPKEFLGATPSPPTVTATRDGNTGKWRVNVSATAEVPTVFASIISLAGLNGMKLFNVGASSEAVRATLDMVLVLDTTNSLGAAFPKVKEGAQNFLTHFSQLDDRVGMVAFATGAYPIVSLCGDFPNNTQNPKANTLNCGRGFQQAEVQQAIGYLNMGGMTDSEEGIKKALNQLEALRSDLHSGKRVIVFFSDGAPNTFNGRFPLVGGGTVEGNLYSGPRHGQYADLVFDPSKYIDYPGTTYRIAALPESETDTSGLYSIKDRSNKRKFAKVNGDPMLFKCDANKAARNMAENVAYQARRQGITIFALGYGEGLDQSEVQDPNCSTSREPGSLVMKRIANTPDSDTYDSRQPTGIFCHAPTVKELEHCFDQIAYGILRLTR